MKTRQYISLLLTLFLSLGAFAQTTNVLSVQELAMSLEEERDLIINMQNEGEVVAVQFTLEIPAGFILRSNFAQLSNRGKDHLITARSMGGNKILVMAYSPTNSSFQGQSGELLHIPIASSDSLVDGQEYTIKIQDAVMSTRSGENLLRAAEAGNIRIKGLPNLHVQSVECSDPVAGSTMTIRWKVVNDGQGSTENAVWKDYVWLVPSVQGGTTMEGAKQYSVGNISALAPGESYENMLNIKLDERIHGNYDIVVAADMSNVLNIDFSPCGGTIPDTYTPTTSSYGYLWGHTTGTVQVQEHGESNGMSDNFFFKHINIAVQPLPDLQVTSVVATVAAEDVTSPSPLTVGGVAQSSAFYSGRRVEVTATIANKGEADIINGSWSNVLYLSDSETLSSAEPIRATEFVSGQTLKAGESMNVKFTTTLPYEWSGDAYFHVQADKGDAIYELANTENNYGHSQRVEVLLTPGADFEPRNLSIPSVLAVNGKLDVKYEVSNIGPGVPFTSSWTDRIYISKSSDGLDSSAQLLGSVNRTGRFQLSTTTGEATSADDYVYVGDSYSVATSFSLSNLTAGTYYIYVVVDANHQVAEYDGEDNNVLMSAPITLQSADLTIELLSVSGDELSTGQSVAVTWKICNIGEGDIQNVAVNNVIYISTSQNGSQSTTWQSLSNTVSLVAGGEKTLRANLTVPKDTSLDGLRYIYMRINPVRQIPESNYNNNTSSFIAKTFKYVADSQPTQPEPQIVQGMNLEVSGIQAVSSAAPGQAINLSYKVANTGTLPISHDVTQEVFLSPTKDFNASTAVPCTITGTSPSLEGLEAGANKQVAFSVTLPTTMRGGQNYLLVVLDRANTLSEIKKTDNRLSKSISITGNLPDLTIADIVWPETVKTSEKNTLRWSVQNGGDWASGATTCVAYLSEDETYSRDDQLLSDVTVSSIPAGGSTELASEITLNDNVVGTRYLIFRINSTQTLEETSYSNNQVSRKFTSQQSPLPDLQISDLSIEGELRGGASVTITAKITNVGDATTRKDKWSDAFYLSGDFTLNKSSARNLGSKGHVGVLQVGESYQVSATVNIPTSLSGYYVLFAETDAANAHVEKGKDNNQAKTAIYIEDGAASPADLTIRSFNVPARITAGEPLTLSYTILNQGAYNAEGTLRDVLYLSRDNQWDENDEMVGVVTGHISLAPGNEVEREVTGRINNVTEGSYYLIVRTNSTRTITESDYDNNRFVASTPATLSFASLGVGASAAVSTSGLFKLPIQAGMVGKTLGLTLTQPEDGAAGIYVAYNRVPSTARYDFSASDFSATQQDVLVPNVQEGTYYILAQDNTAISRSLNTFSLTGEQEPEETLMTLATREVSFGATSLAITEGGTGGWLSTDLRGALLDSIMDFRLVSEGEMIPVESVTFHDETYNKVTFNLNDAKTGSYDLVSELPDGSLATMENGFRVVPGRAVGLGVKLDAPSVVHSGSFAPISIAYTNGGNTDIVIRELLITIDKGYLATSIEGLKEQKSELHIRPDTSMDSRGFCIIPPGKQEVITCFMLQIVGTSHLSLYIVK